MMVMLFSLRIGLWQLWGSCFHHDNFFSLSIGLWQCAGYIHLWGSCFHHDDFSLSQDWVMAVRGQAETRIKVGAAGAAGLLLFLALVRYLLPISYI